ncbi:MAG: nodulation protein NfeD [Actinomycetota bacterium]
MKLVRASIALSLLFAALFLSSTAHAKGPQVIQAPIDGVVDPLEASFIDGVIEEAEDIGATVLITIDTPGGLDSSMRKIVRSILNARVPIVCYVSPRGARAASAGTFILMSCPVAAMAPGTNVGAAHPVGVSGAIQSRKVTNDAVGFIRSIAEGRDRNADWAEEAVRDSVSISANEALKLKVIDLIAPNVDALLTQIDGREILVGETKVELATKGLAVQERKLGTGARLLHVLFDPNLAFIFFYAGLILVVIELLHPGVSIPGITGGALLVIALASFGMLPVQLLGLLLLIASVVFFLVELKAPGIGASMVAGLVALVVGGLFLFDRSVPDSQVTPGVIVPIAITMALFFAFVVQAALKARNLPLAQGSERVVGREGYAVTDVSLAGVVHVGSEQWSAESDHPISKGQPIRVTGLQGLTLKVERTSADADQPKGDE